MCLHSRQIPVCPGSGQLQIYVYVQVSYMCVSVLVSYTCVQVQVSYTCTPMFRSSIHVYVYGQVRFMCVLVWCVCMHVKQSEQSDNKVNRHRFMGSQ